MYDRISDVTTKITSLQDDLLQWVQQEGER
jgi:hypothetical protein